MCGITGVYSFKGTLDAMCIKRMTDTLRHRGPDDEGFLSVNFESGEAYPLTGKESQVPGRKLEDFDKQAQLFVGHRRLSILDLSPAGHQPMSNESGTLWIVHNGEVYNYLEIRKELEALGYPFRSQTDTEVILRAYEAWGVDCLSRFNGMWAFAVVDLKEKKIFCSRDRAGVKPFYYLYDDERFCFASEIKALLQIEDFDPQTNERVIDDYLVDGLLDHTSETFFKNIYQLRPGEYLLLDLLGDGRLILRSYWDIEDREIRFPRDRDYIDRFYELLEDSIRLRLRTDVPIGSCLSGGLDSSSIVCLANRLLFNGQSLDPKLVGRSQKTFSSCFEDPVFDERKYIELVVNKTGSDRHYVFPEGKGFLKNLIRLIWLQEEPFGSLSIYAQWEVMKLAKERGVKVLLDGQGGDELLAGYLPSFGPLLKQTLKQFAWVSFIKEIRGFLKYQRQTVDQLWSRFRASPSPSDWLERGLEKQPSRKVVTPCRFKERLNDYLYQLFRFVALPGLLHYEDRNSMAHSIETRLPFLDYRLVEFVFGLPAKFKIRRGVTKIILREAMEGVLPEGVRNRMDKMGFVVPEADWFRNELRDFIDDILNSNSFSERGLFNLSRIHKAFQDHCDGRADHHTMIWRCVNLELWFRMFVDQKPSSQTCFGN